jgi:hypothetical protein
MLRADIATTTVRCAMSIAVGAARRSSIDFVRDLITLIHGSDFRAAVMALEQVKIEPFIAHRVLPIYSFASA